MINLNTNISSLITQRSLAKSTLRLNQAIEQMTTGFKINHAKDNAANYNITTNMTTKIGAYMVAEDNCAMGLDLLATANGSLDQIADKLQRLRALAVQVSNGTYGTQSKEAINQEANAIIDEIERIYNTTEYNGINVMKGQLTGVEESKFIKDIDRRDTSRMTTLASVDPDKALTSGTYSISTPEELAKLATMTNNGLIGAGTEFVLGADIDLSGYADWTPIGVMELTSAGSLLGNYFKASFNGNGFKIQNLSTVSSKDCVGLFGAAREACLTNISLENVDIQSNIAEGNFIAPLVGYLRDSVVENCNATGVITSTVDLYYVGGLSGYSRGSSLSNCYVNCNISTADSKYVAGFIGVAEKGCFIENCSATGDINGFDDVAGLIGVVSDSQIYRSYSSANVNASKDAGHFTANVSNAVTLKDCYSTGSTVGDNVSFAGNLNFHVKGGTSLIISNCSVLGESSDSVAIFVSKKYLSGESDVIIENCSYNSYYDTLGLSLCADNSVKLRASGVSACDENVKPYEILNLSKISSYFVGNSAIQVGVNSDDSSQISVLTEIFMSDLNSIRKLGIVDYMTQQCLSKIDSITDLVSNKQVELGATQNRLESALEEISVQYENLVSSRSTLRDADISEVSSEYIRQQILQQASATLMATANQSPSIALQLI